jgi:hypothetical protein
LRLRTNASLAIAYDGLHQVEPDVADRAGRVHLELQYTPPSPAWADVQTIVGTWLSLVERTLGVGEVASSNLVVPTNNFSDSHDGG